MKENDINVDHQDRISIDVREKIYNIQKKRREMEEKEKSEKLQHYTFSHLLRKRETSRPLAR